MRNRVQRALLVRQLAAVPERELEREDADDPVDRARARRTRRARGPRSPSTGRSCSPAAPAERSASVVVNCCMWILLSTGFAARSRGTQTVMAPASTLTLNALTFVRSPPSSS